MQTFLCNFEQFDVLFQILTFVTHQQLCLTLEDVNADECRIEIEQYTVTTLCSVQYYGAMF